ncbi:MAG: hypothetical protein JF597_11240 [Streptomyces sp.]|nr:hypothetical protein [Streptomyces sp.]MBW8794140.1 hypothetical protein [Streptomyces sp.]
MASILIRGQGDPGQSCEAAYGAVGVARGRFERRRAVRAFDVFGGGQ